MGSAEEDLRIASRSILELTATVMDAAFETLGEGVVLGTMPAYLQTFGAQNARYLDKRFGPFDTSSGAVAALAPLNLVSRVTDTPYAMVDATTTHATKRLSVCEFAGAFARKSPFARAMVCQLHRAVYQGSANALLPKGHPGYNVELGSRILFGDAHCDFEVRQRHLTAGVPSLQQRDTLPPAVDGVVAQDALAFYTAILVAFVDYLSTVLPREALEGILARSAVQVGAKVHHLFLAGLRVQDKTEASDLIASMLASGGRTVERPAGLPVAKVTACAMAQPIVATTKARGPDAPAVRAAACLLCKGVLQGALDAVQPGLRVVRDSTLTLGDHDCRYRVEGP